MSFSASFLFQGGSVSDLFSAASEREAGPTVKGKLRVNKEKRWPSKEIKQCALRHWEHSST